MDLERIMVSSSSSSSSPSLMTTYSTAEDAADRTEMEAAEALADLAQLAIMREKKVTGSAVKWGSKGKRVRKRFKDESSPDDFLLNRVDSEAPFPDLAEVELLYAALKEYICVKQEKAVQEGQQAQEIGGNLTIEAVKAEVGTESPKPNPACVEAEVDSESPKPNPACIARCRTAGSGRLRQNLTEAEKEERRIRRILANRESARQTIRRRQALCEELTRKAADLTNENANLKREKELTVKEYQSLVTLNKNLKEQISKSLEPEAEKTQEELKSSHGEIPASHQLYFYNQQPFQLLCWPSIIQTSHPVQSQLKPYQNGFTIPSITPTMVPDKFMPSQQQENPVNDGVPKTPLYIMPCPLFISNTDQRNGVPPALSFGFKTTQDGVAMYNHQNGNSSPKSIGEIEKMPAHLPLRIKEEDSSGSTESRTLSDLRESVAGFPSEGGGQLTGFHSKEQQDSAASTFISKSEDAFNGGITTKLGHAAAALLEKKQEMIEYSSKKLVDSVAAAEARKRRKELTRLKTLHGRQFRMHV